MFSLYARLQPVIADAKIQQKYLDLLIRLQECRVIVAGKLHQMELDGDTVEAEAYGPGFNILIMKINEIEDKLAIQPKTAISPIWRETFGSPI